MSRSSNQAKTDHRVSPKALRVITGVFAIGLVPMAIAQPCDPVEKTKFLAPDGAAFDEFGHAVSINGNTAVVGVPFDDANGENSGSVFVFVLEDGIWTQQANILPLDGSADDEFGESVSIHGDTLVIGATRNDTNGLPNFGAAYVFVRGNGVWTQQAKLLPDDGTQFQFFGSAVSISSDTIIVGSARDNNGLGTIAGSAYIYTRSEGLWTQQAKLLADDGAGFDQFGSSVSIDGNTAVISTELDDDNGSNSGSAYIFTRSGGTWVQQTKLLPDDGMIGDRFGSSASISGDTVVIGAFTSSNSATSTGSAYVFTRSQGVWTQESKLLADDRGLADYFGKSVAISGDTVVVGSYWDNDNGRDSGSAYVYTRTDGTWTQQAKFTPSDGELDENFGWSVAIDGDTTIVASRRDDENGTESGSAYIFELGCSSCPVDLNNDGQLDFFDISGFLLLFQLQDPIADLTGDGMWNFFDVSAFLSAYAAGCP